MSFELKPALSDADIAGIRLLAEEIWPNVFAQILPPEQIAYMMEMMYAGDTLKKEIREQNIKYFIALNNGEPIGYTAFGSYSNDTVKIHKLYLHPNARGNGYGRKMIEFIAETARKQGISSLTLNVNRDNTNSIAIYKKLGFTIEKSIDNNIGNNFYMNDFIMAMPL